MRSLGDAVGLTPGALYRYFANKEEVTEAVFGGADGLDDRLLAAAKTRASDVAAVRGVLKAYADFAFADEVRFRTLFLKHHGPAGRAFHARGSHRPGAMAARQRIEAAIAAGVFRKMDADLAFQLLWSAVHGAVVLILTAEGFPFAGRSKVVDAAIDNALRGLAETKPIKHAAPVRPRMVRDGAK